MKGSQKKKKANKNKSPNPFFHALLFLSCITALLLFLTIFMVGKIFAVKLTPLESRPQKTVTYPALTNSAVPKISAGAAIVYDRKTGVKVFEKNSNTRFTPASTVKIMTAVIALETYKKNDILTANGVDTVLGSQMNLVEGERIRVIDLLYGLMLPSGNDAAYVFATNYPDGGYNGFVKKMNEKAQDLGLTSTRYIDPAGYDDANYTTATDLAKLADFALSNSTIQKIVDTKKITVTDISGKISHDLVNLNRLLDYTNVYGLKTGFTNAAGGVLVTSISSAQREYIVVVMQSEDRFRDTQILMADIIRNIEPIKF